MVTVCGSSIELQQMNLNGELKNLTVKIDSNSILKGHFAYIEVKKG